MRIRMGRFLTDRKEVTIYMNNSRNWVGLFLLSCIALLAGCSQSPVGSPETKATSTASVSKYEGKLVRLAGGGEESAKVYFVEHGSKRWVQSIDWIKKRGFRWPDDVVEAPRSELDAMPEGAVIPGP